jgi:UDP-N-acetyl-D-mannosaminuronic acid dehydrogenase
MITLPDDFSDKKVCVLGLGYVGLTLAVAMARVGFVVHGLEVRTEVIRKLKAGNAHFWEKDLDTSLNQVINNGNFTFSETLDKSLDFSVYIVTVGTPLDTNRKARLDMIKNATQQIASHMSDGALVVLRSTVKIGTARKIIMPILEETGKKFEIAVCPERTLEGQALEELNSLPQIIGSDSQSTLFRAGKVFNFLTPTILRVNSLESAEVIKLVDNTYRDVMFGFANEVARLCDAVGISAHEVIRSGKLGYERTNVASPGPVGGPCLEKDPHILAESARSYGIDLDITPASRRVNERQPLEVVNFIKKTARLKKDFPLQPKISLLGIAFKGKPETNDLRGTVAKPILDLINKEFPNSILQGFDPVVENKAIEEFGLIPLSTIKEAFEGANIVIILNNHPLFSQITLDEKIGIMAKDGFIYDLWGLYSGLDHKDLTSSSYFALGSQIV